MSQVKIKDIRMAYETAGKGQPIVFIHGAYISKDEWEHQKDFFAADYQAVFIDLPGHGGSDKLPVYSIEQMAEYVAAFIEKMEFSPCILCGHSFGGMVAQSLAIQYPALASKLILVETSYGVRSNLLESFLTTLSMPILKRVSVEKQTALFAADMGKQSAETKAYVAKDIIRHADDHDNYNRIWDATVNYDGKSKLKEINCATLIIAGQKNRQTHHQAKVMHSEIAGSKLVFIQNAGHMVNMDNPEGFNQAVLRFLQA